MPEGQPAEAETIRGPLDVKAVAQRIGARLDAHVGGGSTKRLDLKAGTDDFHNAAEDLADAYLNAHQGTLERIADLEAQVEALIKRVNALAALP